MTAVQTAALKSAGTYANVHSAAFPGGEVRGQVIQANTSRYVATLSGANEVPPNNSAATGEIVAFLHQPDNVVSYVVTTTGITATAAHLHQAAVGNNGPVIVPLRGGPSVWCGASQKLTAAQLSALTSGGVYVNVHSTAFPGGEIRGQLLADSGDFGCWMDGTRMVPPVATNGTGQMCLELNPDHTLSYRGIEHGVGANAAEIRRGATGQNGPVVLPLMRAPGNTWGGTTRVLTAAELTDLRAGRWHVVYMSNTDPNGEIRGQLAAITLPENYGDGCPGSGGRRARIGTEIGPCMGAFLPIRLYEAQPNTPCVLTFGGTRSSPPQSLAPIGMGNHCYLYHDLLVTFPTSTDSNGCARALVELPFDKRFPGIVLQSSWFAVDVGANVLGLVGSNAMSFTVQ